eukprot:gene3797-4858_t
MVPGVNLELLVLATGAGSLILSHVNDAGFWLVKQYFNMTVAETFKTWTAMETILSIVALGFIMLLSLVSVLGGIPTRSVGTISGRLHFSVVHRPSGKLWKTNPHTSSSATYSRRKSLFCHTNDLSPSTVEPAVGNMGVAGCKPLSTRPTQVYDRNMTFKPVDKSVVKLWKDWCRGRIYWPGAMHPDSSSRR